MRIKQHVYMLLYFVLSTVHMDSGVIGYRVFWSGSRTNNGSWICNGTDCSQNYCVSTYIYVNVAYKVYIHASTYVAIRI